MISHRSVFRGNSPIENQGEMTGRLRLLGCETDRNRGVRVSSMFRPGHVTNISFPRATPPLSNKAEVSSSQDKTRRNRRLHTHTDSFVSMLHRNSFFPQLPRKGKRRCCHLVRCSCGAFSRRSRCLTSHLIYLSLSLPLGGLSRVLGHLLPHLVRFQGDLVLQGRGVVGLLDGVSLVWGWGGPTDGTRHRRKLQLRRDKGRKTQN